MNQITDFKQLIEGQEYDIYCKPFDVVNRCRLISHDTTILKRPITYWQFSERGKPKMTREKLRLMFDGNKYPDVFALWDFDLKNNDITSIS